jgi:cytochrome c oxidase assembly protein subunit 11
MEQQRQKNIRTGLTVLAVVAVMLGLSFAAVPFYKVFCRVTGYGGTTQVAVTAPAVDQIINRIVTVKFNSEVARGMPWRFAPQQREIAVKLGSKVLVAYNAENLSDRAITGMAVYNVTPEKAGRYFKKIQCFCFNQQTLKPHEKVNMPVLFFVDPALDKDPELNDLTTITLSYTFFNADLDKPEEDSYNSRAVSPPKNAQ